MVGRKENPSEFLPTLLEIEKSRVGGLIENWKNKLIENWAQLEIDPQGEEDLTKLNSLSLIDLSQSLPPRKQAVFAEKDKKLTEEVWILAAPVKKPGALWETFPLDMQVALERVSIALGVDANCILEAAIKTQVLQGEFLKAHRPVCVALDNEFESLILRESPPDPTATIVSRMHVLEFYSSFLNVNGVPIHSLTVHFNLPELNFPNLFGPTLVLTSYSASQTKPTEVSPAQD